MKIRHQFLTIASASLQTLCAALAIPRAAAATFTDNNWISMSGASFSEEAIYAAVADSAGNLYVGGGFANGIARWDGTNWSQVGRGTDGGVFALAISGSDLYVGGSFTTAINTDGTTVTANGIAKWNGTNWSALGSGVGSLFGDASVSALVVLGSDVYAGGDFTSAGDVAATNVARWNGSSWSGVGPGINGWVRALAVSGSNLYAGGNFTMAGGVSANRIATWNGSNWSALGSGMNDAVSTLAVLGGDLYAGGEFTSAGGISAARFVAKWNGTAWSALGSGVNSSVHSLAVLSNELYVSGSFTTAGGNAVNRVAKWNGSAWSALGSGIVTDGSASIANNILLAATGTHLYAVTRFLFEDVSGSSYFTARVGKWSGSDWSWGSFGFNGPVDALAASGNILYAGGRFTLAGDGSPAIRIAKWNGSSWSALGRGMNGSVSALAAAGSDLYAGGSFTTATNADGTAVAVNHIAKWNGSSWSALGSGMSGGPSPWVFALAVAGNDLYAGGGFTNAGGIAANRIAKWNGDSWSALGSGMSNTVRALAVAGNEIYAGGDFMYAGGVAANYIAKWNGSTWSAAGAGMNNTVWALAVSGSNLYAGGSFSTAGGLPANYVAKWDGSNWSALGSGVDRVGRRPDVYSLAVSGDDLFVGGRFFETAGGVPAVRIAKWNGSSWSGLGSGINSSVFALAVIGNDLYAGGFYSIAGDKISAYLARARISFTPDNLALKANTPGAQTNTLTYAGVPNFPYIVQYATNLTGSPWFTLSTNTPAANGVGTAIDPSATDPQRFYRVGYRE